MTIGIEVATTNTSAANNTTATISLTVPSSKLGKFIAVTGYIKNTGGGNVDLSTCTFDGVAMTQAELYKPGQESIGLIYYLPYSGATGAKNLTLTWSANSHWALVGFIFSNVAGVRPVTYNAALTLSGIVCSRNDLLLDHIFERGNQTYNTPGGGQTERLNFWLNSGVNAASTKFATSASESMSWAGGSSIDRHSALPFFESLGGNPVSVTPYIMT